jgi:hypothetical protein
VWADFNGDGRDDLAIGVPREDLGATDEGAVHIIYGTAAGLSATGSQLWTQDSAGILDAAESGDKFGSSLAGGDFNGDGFADLAIGVPDEFMNGVTAGAVQVIYGSASGLTATGNQFWHQDVNRVRDVAEGFDGFGFALASGDFNNDGNADLAVGVPFEQIGIFANTGAVHIFYGTFTGLQAANGLFLHQDFPNVPDSIEGSEHFGYALTTGDFNGDNFADIAIGARHESVGAESSAGAVTVLPGGPTGITGVGSQIWDQDSAGIQETAEDFDEFGAALTAGDFNDDGRADLAIGVTGEDLAPGGGNEGAAHVLYGSATLLTDVGDQFWTHNNVGGNIAESGEVFGSALAAGNLGGSSHDELAIGAFGQDVGVEFAAGSVVVLSGTASGLTSVGSVTLEQEDAGAVSGSLDNFGRALAIGDFNGGGLDDLAVGTPGEDVSGNNGAGAVYVFYSSGLEQTWHQDTAGIAGGSEPNDGFGAAVNSGNSANGGSRDDGGDAWARLLTAFDDGTPNDVSAASVLRRSKRLNFRR